MFKRPYGKLLNYFAGVCLSLFAVECEAGPLLPPVQVGNLLKMTNANVRLDYDLSTGRANFYWQNALKITGFYAGVGLDTYITGTVYTNRTWSVSNNQVVVTSMRGDLPTMKQIFIMDQDNSFLTRCEMIGSGLQSRWMGPLVMDTTGGVDIGSYSDNRALIVPFDNDSFTFSYNALPINSTGGSYEASAFYDNTSRNGLVVGSVTHDTWKTGVYFEGANNRLSVLNVYGGVTSSDTRDVEPHGLVAGNLISSPTVYVGFGSDWRTVLETYADANAAIAPMLAWSGGPPFGWNSWYAYQTSVSYSNATAASSFIRNNLQTNNFNDQGTVYINLDSFWSNLSDPELIQFASYCHSNGQKAGIYWTPFVYWGTAQQGSNDFMTGSGTYKWSDAYLRRANGEVQTNDNGIALDPTHPGFKQMTAYYLNFFKSRGFEYLKLDFLTHGATEGVHYDTNVTTGIQAYNQGMQYLLSQNNGAMFLSESIAPIFPYQYAHSRRIYCDASGSINDTSATMQAVNYGWWLGGRLYRFNDPDMMKFAGVSANENQSRLINCAVAGTVFLNSDDVASASGQNLARTCLTNARINEVARSGVSFRPVEGNTGASAGDVFVRQDGSTWYVAVFNYSVLPANKSLNLSRLGISGAYTAQDLWSGATFSVSGATWSVSLGSKQAKLFRLGSGNTSASGPIDQAVSLGDSVTLATHVSGTPPFNYIWKKNGVILGGQNASAIAINPVNWKDAGTYTVEIIGGSGNATNTAILTILQGALKWVAGNGNWDLSSAGLWKDSLGTNAVYSDGADVIFGDSTNGASAITVTLNQTVAPGSVTASNSSRDFLMQGAGGITGGSTELAKVGSGKLILATDNSYAGATVIEGGVLQIGNGGTSGSLGGGFLTNNATLAFNRGDTCVFPTLAGNYPALLGGPGTLQQIGSGKLVFSYQYVFGQWVSTPKQGLYVGPGAVAESAAYNPVGAVTLEGGTLSASGGASDAYQSWVLSGGVTVLRNLQTSVITNNSTVNAFSQIELRDNTVFKVAGGATNGIDLFVPAVLTHSYWEYGNWGTLVKTGNGRMVLTATNLYQGETVVAGGSLVLQSPGSIGASGFPLTVQAGGHFGGSGTINRNAGVQAGGFLEPGNDDQSIGALTFTGNLSLAGTLRIKVDKSVTPSNDLVAVSGSLTFGGALIVTNLGPTPGLGDGFKLFSKAGTASFASITLPTLPSGLGWTNKLAADGSIQVVSTVNLHPTNLLAHLTNGNLDLSWPADQTGWCLQTQMGSLGTNWLDVAGSEATNRWLLPGSNQVAFFRLIFRGPMP